MNGKYYYPPQREGAAGQKRVQNRVMLYKGSFKGFREGYYKGCYGGNHKAYYQGLMYGYHKAGVGFRASKCKRVSYRAS